MSTRINHDLCIDHVALSPTPGTPIGSFIKAVRLYAIEHDVHFTATHNGRDMTGSHESTAAELYAQWKVDDE